MLPEDVKKYILEAKRSKFISLNPEIDEVGTAFLDALKKATPANMKDIGSNVKALELDYIIKEGKIDESNINIAPKAIFIRKHYNHMHQFIRKREKIAVIGNFNVFHKANTLNLSFPYT